MRIRNRPAPSVFPPPPDLNLNRRSFFPQSSPQVQLASASAAAATEPASASNFSLATTRSVKVSTAKRSPARAAADNSNSQDDNNDADSNASSWKDESVEDDDDTGVQRPSHPRGIVSKGAAVKRGSRVGAAAVTEGSRCSRVNGRGWRCGQQTLVGYSLCEHHLGKSRLRSLSSVKNNDFTSWSKDNLAVAALSSNKKKRLVEESDDDDEPLLTSSGKKKSRIGTVKARSLRSLLGQTSQTSGVSQSLSAHKRNANN